MSYLHPVNEELTVVFCFRHPTSGAALTGIEASIDVTVYDEAYESFETGNPTEIAKGLYYYTFTPDADGIWTPIAEYEGVSPVLTAPKAFLVGTDLETLIDAIKASTDTIDWTDITDILADTNEIQAALADGGFTDLLIDAIKAKTDLIGASVAPASEYDTEAAHLDADISAIIQQVALTGHPANSIGKILYDFYNTRLTSTRTGYLDNLSAGAVALEATLTAIKGDGWTDETLKATKDAVDGLNDLAQSDILNDATPFAGGDVADIKTATDKIREPESDTTSSPFTLQNNTDEQTIIEETPTVFTKYHGIMLDIDALTKTVSAVKVYFKVDGSNYRENVSMRLSSVPASIPMLFTDEFSSDTDWKVTIQMSEAEGATRDIPYRILKEENTS